MTNIPQHDDNIELLLKIQDEMRERRQGGFAIASLVLGIISIPGAFFLPGIVSILAIIFGALSIKSRRRSMAIAGIVTGSVGLFLIIAFSVLFAISKIQLIEKSPEIRHIFT